MSVSRPGILSVLLFLLVVAPGLGTEGLVVSATAAWSGATFADDFGGAAVDVDPPLPQWWPETHNHMEMAVTGGWLRMHSQPGTWGWGEVRTRTPEPYRDFSLYTRFAVPRTASVQAATGEAVISVRFRVNHRAAGYGVWFDIGAASQTVSLRRVDRRDRIGEVDAPITLTDGAEVHVWVECVGPRIAARVGTTPGGAELAELRAEDETFDAGSIWLSNLYVQDVRWDYLYVGPPGWRPGAGVEP